MPFVMEWFYSWFVDGLAAPGFPGPWRCAFTFLLYDNFKKNPKYFKLLRAHM